MPPKDKKKIAEDKTFGLKNKNKSKKVREYVDLVVSQAGKSGNKHEQDVMNAKLQRDKEKKLAEDKKREVAALFNQTIIQQKVPFGVDPKTVICAHFKAGQCTKSAERCKFSHDLNVTRKVEKANLYQDARTDNKEADGKEDTMENWNQDQLESAIKEREKNRVNLNRETDIVCKHFLEAIETSKYGWFWECENGIDCKYRHALPPGFVLKKRETEEERRDREQREKANQITIEDFLEKERHALGPNTTPVTAESFAKWKNERVAKRQAAEDAVNKIKMEALGRMKTGLKSAGVVFSGRDMFEYNPEWVGAGDDDEADGDEGMDLSQYKRRTSVDEDERHADQERENDDRMNRSQTLLETLQVDDDLE